MEEGAEENINYRSASFKDAILALEKKELIPEINEFAEKRNCLVSICYPRDKHKAQEIHFILGIINSENIPSIGEKAEISAHIADSIEYDKVEVNFVTCDQKTFNELYEEDVTPFTLENYDKVLKFFQKHYPECYRDTDVDTHLDRKRGSVSPASSSIFSRNGRSQKGEPEAADKIVEHLKDSPLWEVIRRSPEVLDEGFKRAKLVLSAELASGIRPTGAVK